MKTSQDKFSRPSDKGRPKPDNGTRPLGGLKQAKGLDEELMGRPRMALIQSTRLAKLRQTGSPV